MLTGVYQIGKYVMDIKDENYYTLIENPGERGNYRHVLKISFIREGQAYKYKEIDYEEFSEDRLNKYAYKKADGANAGDHTPTSILNLKNPDKTLRNIIKPIRRIKDAIKDKKDRDYIMLSDIYNFINENSETLFNHINIKLKLLNISQKEGVIITIVILENGEERYVGDFPIYIKHLEKINDKRFYYKYKKESKGYGKCYYCNKEKEVMGFVNTYNFYTVDKKSFVTGGFNQENSWINYPVCLDCAHVLDAGKKYIFNNLRSKFSSFNYFVIPKVMMPEKSVTEDMHIILRELEKGSKFSTAEEVKDNLLNSEDGFIELMQDNDNNMNYNILIYKEENAAFRILLFIEDVVPSRIKNILRVKEQLENKYSQNILDSLANNKFAFDKFRYFFPNNKEEGNFDKHFLEILNNIFKSRQISYDFVLNRVMEKTRWIFSKEENFSTSILLGLICMLFIENLQLFDKKEKGVDNIMAEINEKKKDYIEFFNTNNEIFDTSCKKAAFLVGDLANKLMNIQYKEKSSKPFYSRLNGLNIDEKTLKRIYVEAINKLNEYGKNYYTVLEELIGEYLLQPINLTNNEISFYFTLGLSLSNKFKTQNKGNEGEDNSDQK